MWGNFLNILKKRIDEALRIIQDWSIIDGQSVQEVKIIHKNVLLFELIHKIYFI